MPNLKKEVFVKQEPPSDLSPDEDVFYCKITDEIFRDYEQFFERTILCNSILWTCSISGRSGLTFQEALESEERARKVLGTFPKYLKRPLLYVAGLTHRTRLSDFNDDVFLYSKDRYFIGEQVDVTVNRIRKTGKVEAVIAPQNRYSTGKDEASDSDSDSVPLIKKAALKPSLYKYVISEKSKVETITVSASQVSRKKGLYTRDKSKLFLKQNCEIKDGKWRVMDAIAKQNKLTDAKFIDFFTGPPPVFERTFRKPKSTPPQKNKPKATAAPPTHSPVEQPPKSLINPEKVTAPQIPTFTPEELARLREEEAEMRRLAREECRRKHEEEKIRRKEERDKEREKKKEEKKLHEEFLREWKRPREDLECDDLKLLPEPTPVQTALPLELFGDAMMILEFLHSFSTVFDLRDHFPNGVSWEMLERALVERDINSPLADILKFLLRAIFNLESVEEEEELQQTTDATLTDDVPDLNGYNNPLSNLIQTATIMSQLPLKRLGEVIDTGIPLKNLHIDSYTVTEVLRLHILGSGARVTQRNVKFRYQQRGGYTSLDDSGLELKHQYPDLVKALSTSIVFDMPAGDKLKLLTALANQVLTYATTRDFMEDSYEKARQTKLELRRLQCAEERREKDALIAKYKRKMEDRERERTEQIKAIIRANEALRDQDGKGEGIMPLDATVPPPTLPNATVEPTPKVLKNLSPEIMDLLTKYAGDYKRNHRKKPAGMTMTTEEVLEQIMDIDEDDLVPDDQAVFVEKKSILEARHKSEVEEKERQLTEELVKSTIASSVTSLGRDRIYRRYWMFESLPGLFIENCDYSVSESMMQPVQQVPRATLVDVDDLPLKSLCKKNDAVAGAGEKASQIKDATGDDKNSSDKENDLVNYKFPALPAFDKDDINADVMIISANCRDVVETKPEPPVVDPVVKQIRGSRQAWSCFDTHDQFERLIDALNTRGYRENALKLTLLENRKRILERIAGCAAKSETGGAGKEMPKLDGDGSRLSEDQMELNVRDMLLDIEERIFVGALGKLKVKDRNIWRDALERGGYDPQSADPVFDRIVPDAHDDRSSNCSDEQQATIKDLACALLQIEQGTERRFIAKPLGTGENITRSKKPRAPVKENPENSDDENSKAEKTLQERWEESLVLCTNLSQVSLYLSTLEHHIIWTKSALHARCRICRRKGDAEHMLLCDGCDRGHHTYCLKPPVKHIPTGDWFCSDCKPPDVYRTPMKTRRKAFSIDSDSENEAHDDESGGESEATAPDSSVLDGSDDEAADDHVNAEHDDPIEDDFHESSCSVCGQGGILICCDNCPLSYHLACTDPPLKKIPKGEWLCSCCVPDVSSTVRVKVKPAKSKRVSSVKNTPVSSQPNSQYNSPASTRPSSRCSKKRGAGSDSDPETPHTSTSGRKQTKSSRLSIENNEDELGRHGKQYSSSSRGKSNVVMMKAVEEVIQEIVKDEEAIPFLKPVSKRLVPDYHLIIESPMDFQTIRNKINRYEYDDHSQLVSDVRLIFNNCMQYNRSNTGIYRAGSRLLRLFDKRVAELPCADVAEADDSPGPSKRSRRH